jgi:hypothetical protein
MRDFFIRPGFLQLLFEWLQKLIKNNVRSVLFVVVLDFALSYFCFFVFFSPFGSLIFEKKSSKLPLFICCQQFKVTDKK